MLKQSVRRSSETVGFEDNDFGLVVESLHGAIVDGEVEVVQQVVLVTTDATASYYAGRALGFFLGIYKSVIVPSKASAAMATVSESVG